MSEMPMTLEEWTSQPRDVERLAFSPSHVLRLADGEAALVEIHEGFLYTEEDLRVGLTKNNVPKPSFVLLDGVVAQWTDEGLVPMTQARLFSLQNLEV